MKTKTLLIAMLAFFAVSSINASNTKKEIISKIKKEMRYPELAISEHLEGDVWVAFRVDDEGKFQVFQSNSANQQLKELVVKKIEEMTPAETETSPNELYHVKFTFKLKS